MPQSATIRHGVRMTNLYRIAARLPSSEQLQTTVDALEVARLDRAQLGVRGLKALFNGNVGAANAAGHAKTADAVRKPESAGALAGMLIGGLVYAGAVIAAGSVILAGGGLGVTLLTSVASGTTGGLIGALTAHGFHDGYGLAIERQIENGGVILWISPRDDQQLQLAKTELAKAGAVLVEDTAVPEAIEA